MRSKRFGIYAENGEEAEKIRDVLRNCWAKYSIQLKGNKVYFEIVASTGKWRTINRGLQLALGW